MNVAAGKTLRVQAGGDVAITNTQANINATSVVVTGAGSTYTTARNLQVKGTFDVLSSANVSSGTGYISTVGALGDGAITVDGPGSIVSLFETYIGQNGLTGSVTFSNGSTGSLGITVVDAGNGTSTGSLTVQSGAFISAGNFSIANNPGTHTGTATINGASSLLGLTGASTATIGAATSTTANLNVQNSGTFSSGTGLTTVNPTGTIAITGGNYISHGDLTLNGGHLTRDSLGTFSIDAGHTLTIQGAGVATFFGGLTDSTASTIAVSGPSSGLSVVTGNLVLEGGSALSISGGAGANIASQINIGLAGANVSSLLVDGTGSNLIGSSMNVAGSGSKGSIAFINGSAGSLGSVGIANTAVAGSDAAFNVESGSSVLATGLIVASISASNIATVTITGANTIFALTSASTSTIGASSASSALVTVDDGATFRTGTGPININGTGEVDIYPGSTLTGAADFGGSGPLNIAGNYSPGTASGANQTTDVTFAQNMTFYGSTNIILEIGGTTPGTQHDQLTFNGPGTPHVTWNGALTVVLINGFIPQRGDTFDLFNFDFTRDAGAFTTINLPALATGLFWRLDQLYSVGSIRVSLTADNYAQWQSGYGTGAFDADDDGDGVPNGIEFLLGTNPKAAFGAGEYPLMELKPVSGANVTAGLTFKIPADSSFDAIYRVSASSDLVTWTSIATKIGGSAWGGSATVTTGSVVAGYTNITVAETLALNTPKRFHRLEAIEP